jgi:hypothetical protein
MSDFDFYILKKYLLIPLLVLYSDPMGPSFAVHAKCIFGKTRRKINLI